MNASGNLRRAERKNVKGLISVEDAISGQMLGRIGNLSTSGLMLVCPKRLNEDALYQIRFALPDGHGGEAMSMEVGVHEQWTEQMVSPGQYWSGMRFIDLGNEDEARLAQWLEQS